MAIVLTNNQENLQPAKLCTSLPNRVGQQNPLVGKRSLEGTIRPHIMDDINETLEDL
jgi:hypothetical protein